MKDTVIGQRYRIESLIGEGGMASVYSATDEKLHRRVAIKILHPHLARNPDVRERFFLEAKTVSTLDHPNIIKVYDFSGLDSEQLWMVTEILYGVDLAEYVRDFPKNRLHYVVATLVTREVCRALNVAHKLNVVHRDIKPENIMMLKNGHVKLMDFGIAKVHRANATQTGMFMGSPSYMSPEQIRGTDVDIRADIYSLSILYYEIVTGQLPYHGQTTAEVINRIMGGRYTPANLLVEELPSPLNEIIVKGLQSSKELRFKDVAQMAQAIDAFLQKVGLRESRTELEEFTTNRARFEERLMHIDRSLGAPKRSKDSRPQEPRSPRPKGPPVPTMVLGDADPTKTTIPPPVPRGNDNDQRPQGAQKVQQNGRSVPPLSKQPQTSQPPRQQQSSVSPSRRTTNPPNSGSNSKGSRKKHYIREVSGVESIRRRSSSSSLILLGIAIGLVLVVFLGRDRFFNVKPRDSRERITEREKDKAQRPPVAKKSEDDQSDEAKPTVEGGTSTFLEPQTIVLENDGKNKPKLPTEKTTSTARPAAPAPSPAAPPPAPPAVVRSPDKAVKTNDDRPRPTEEKNKPEVTPVASAASETKTEDKIPKEAKGPSSLKVSSVPAGRVFIDGKAYGTTNESVSGKGIRLDPGTYSVKVSRPGYRSEEQTIQLKAGETRQMSMTLAKAGDVIELSIRSNRLPATAVIEDTKNAAWRKEVNLNKPVVQVKLKPGTYRVEVNYQQETINRVMELSEENKSITFNADFNR